MSFLLLVAIVLAITFCLCWLLLRYANVLNLLDVPNQRSSHLVPKARGGGVAFALTFLASLLVLVTNADVDNHLLIAVLGAGTVVAVLGLVLAVLSLQAAWFKSDLLWSWIILLGVFVVDATFTLLRRLLRGDKVYEAHRSHAYQYASRQFAGHRPVTLSVLLINLAWLLPMAVLVGLGYVDGLLGVVIAYLPLVILAVKFKAGQLEKSAG